MKLNGWQKTCVAKLDCSLGGRGGLAVNVSSYEATEPGSIFGIAIFPGGIADSRRFESRGGYSRAIKMSAQKPAEILLYHTVPLC